MANEYVVTTVGGLVVGRATFAPVRVYSFAVLVLRTIEDGVFPGASGSPSARMQIIS